MNIVFVCRYYPPEKYVSGIATYTRILSQTLAKRGHKVTIITQGNGMHYWEAGVRVIRIIPHNARWLVRRPVGGLRIYDRLGITADWYAWSYSVHLVIKALSSRREVDIVEAPDFAAEGFFCTLRKYVPVIVKMHGPAALILPNNQMRVDWRSRLAFWQERLAVKRASFVTSPSAAMAKWARKSWQLCQSQIQIIPNPIDLEFFRPAENNSQLSELDWRMQSRQILYVGRMEQNKGVLTLLEAFANVSIRVPNYELWLAGSDNYAKDGNSYPFADLLQSFFEKTPLPLQVRWLGRVPRNELVKLYQQSIICVFPSKSFDNFPYTCLEAMACGVSVIGTYSGGMSEMIVDGLTGYLVPPDDTSSLSAALCTLLEDPSRAVAMGMAGRCRVEELFSAEKIAEATLDVYKHVCELEP